jgi:hypothetical protein
MARLLFDGSLFDPVAPNALSTGEYARLVLDSAVLLYPSYVPVAFDIPIRNGRGNAQPNLALIDAAYRDWWLVVLETGDPPTLEQVAKTIETLRAARYGEHAKALSDKNATIDRQKLSNLLRRELPRIFVLISHLPLPPVREESACVGVAEVFEHAATQRRILRINGHHPTASLDLLTLCTRHTIIPGIVLEMEQPEKVPPWDKDESEVEIGDVVTVWRRAEETITPVTACSLPGGHRFRLMRTASGRLRIVPA